MRHAMIGVLALAGCAGGAESGRDGNLAPLPFPVERGSALAPPGASSAQTAPPEGQGAAGLDFGQWRQGDPAEYTAAFRQQIAGRYAGRADIRADLEANGFACEQGTRLDCRIEIMERDCAYDWYVVVEPNSREPIAGFDQMCAGARERG